MNNEQIKILQQQLIQAEQERDRAYASEANWHKLYETEAQQRRIEAELAQQTLAELKAKIQELQAHRKDYSGTVGESISDEAIASLVEELQIPAELKQKLFDALGERDRLVRALQAEKEQHARTKQSLTSALVDAIEQLNKNRVQKEASSEGTVDS
ncbi:MAG: hypothetical protein GDA48_16160 [Hormoscilla sp. GM102CHS1]|nr:hypothetical protein [Hormoscilla sp. GM102CHS1]